MLVPDRRHRIARVVPENLPVAVVPGIEPLVELQCKLWIHTGTSRRPGHQFRVQQPPGELLGQVVGKLATARAVFALHGYHFDWGMHHRAVDLRESRIQRNVRKAKQAPEGATSRA